MNLVLMKGTFHVVGFSPDGDSMMFKPNKEGLWKKVGGVKKEEEDGGAVQLRLQGIDSLETHYSPETLLTPHDLQANETKTMLELKPRPKSFRQPGDIAEEATKRFMAILGVQEAHWRNVFHGRWVDWIKKDGKVVGVEKNPVDKKKRLVDQIDGYIVASGVEKNGRPLAWVFAGNTRYSDGRLLEEKDLINLFDRSANYQLLEEGLVYPYFFDTLDKKLMEILKGAAQKAAKKSNSVWAKDKTTTGVKISTVEKIQAEVIFPDLFRKVIKGWYRQNMELYWKALVSNTTFKEKTVIDLKNFASGDRFEVKKDGTLLMKNHPWDLVFKS